MENVMLEVAENTTQQGASIHERLVAFNRGEQKSDDSQTETFAEDSSSDDTRKKPQNDVKDDLEVESESHETETEESEITDESAETEAKDESAQDGETETVEYKLSDIAQLVGYDEDKLSISDDGKILVKTKVDGKVGEASLDDLVRAYQKAGHLDNRTQQAAELQKALEAQKAESQQQLEAKLNELNSLASLAYSELTNEYNSIDWNELRQDDPAEFAAKQEEFRQRQDRINQSFQAMQYEQQRLQAQNQEQLQRVIAEENQKLVNAIDGWTDNEVAQKEYKQVLNYAESLGYPSNTLGNIQNHLDVVVLRKAMLYDQMQQKKPEIKKVVRAIPKIAKPGQGTVADKSTQLQKQYEKLRVDMRNGVKGAAAEAMKLKRQIEATR